MKIKIKKNILVQERYELTPSNILPLKQMFVKLGLLQNQKEELESLFNKDLLFYDLETTGLRRSEGKSGQISDMIHQIAILKYSPAGNPENIKAEKPDDYYVAKATITSEYSERSLNVKKDRAFILNQTNAGEYKDYKKFIENDFLNLGAKNYTEVKENMALFMHILTNYPIKSIKKKEIKSKQNHTLLKNKIIEYAKTLNIDNIEEIPNIIDNSNPSREELLFLYDNIFNEDTLEGGISTHYNNVGQPTIKEYLDKIILFISQTEEENKVFTNYDQFPLDKYKSKGYKGPISEKDALQGMMNFIDTQGNPSQDETLRGDYVLVGQNIISFDNPFVIARCKQHGITNTENFRNSYVYDTRFLFSAMIKYFQTLSYFYGLVKTAHLMIEDLESYKERETDPEKIKTYEIALEEFGQIGNLKDPQILKNAEEVKGILKKLKKSGKAKGKLETLMRAFIEEAPKQTHTADDDCEKLAAVFIPAMQKFHEIYNKTFDFVVEMDKIKITAVYRIVKSSPIDPETKKKKKTIPSEIGKTKSPLGFERTSGIGSIVDRVARKFVEDLSFEYLQKQGLTKDLAQNIIKMYLTTQEHLKGKKSDAEKLEVFNKYLNYTEPETIKWFEQHKSAFKDMIVLPDEIEKLKKLKENKKRLKIKILKENKNG